MSNLGTSWKPSEKKTRLGLGLKLKGIEGGTQFETRYEASDLSERDKLEQLKEAYTTRHICADSIEPGETEEGLLVTDPRTAISFGLHTTKGLGHHPGQGLSYGEKEIQILIGKSETEGHYDRSTRKTYLIGSPDNWLAATHLTPSPGSTSTAEFLSHLVIKAAGRQLSPNEQYDSGEPDKRINFMRRIFDASNPHRWTPEHPYPTVKTTYIYDCAVQTPGDGEKPPTTEILGLLVAVERLVPIIKRRPG